MSGPPAEGGAALLQDQEVHVAAGMAAGWQVFTENTAYLADEVANTLAGEG